MAKPGEVRDAIPHNLRRELLDQRCDCLCIEVSGQQRCWQPVFWRVQLHRKINCTNATCLIVVQWMISHLARPLKLDKHDGVPVQRDIIQLRRVSKSFTHDFKAKAKSVPACFQQGQWHKRLEAVCLESETSFHRQPAPSIQQTNKQPCSKNSTLCSTNSALMKIATQGR